MYEEINLFLNILNSGTSIFGLVFLILLNKQVLFNTAATCFSYHNLDERLKTIEKIVGIPPPYSEQDEESEEDEAEQIPYTRYM